MSSSKEEKNKAFVLEAFETLFNKRDYAAAERFWSPNYIQHSAHIPPGREGLLALIKGVPDNFHYEKRAHRRQWRLRAAPRPLHGPWPTGELDRGGYRAPRERPTGRTLGRHPGRGDKGSIRQWPAHVRRQISHLTVAAKRTRNHSE